MTVTESLERRAPAQDAWPLFGIRITTPRLELRVVDDLLIPELARVARDGVHDPGHMPFGNGWTDRPDEDWHTGFARYFWLQRGRWDVSSWALPFAVFADGDPIGVQQLTAADFPVLKTFGTGSWLSLSHQGRGLGTEMRAAVLHFGFRTLAAELAVTGAFPTNEGSIRVSEKLGYLPNGVRRDRVRGRPVDAMLFRLPRERWEVHGPCPRRGRGIRGLRAPVRAGCKPGAGARAVSRAAVWDNVGVALPLWPDPEELDEINLDFAATTPALVAAVEAVQAAIPWYGSLHRGGGRKSAYSTTLFEEARLAVARFVGCDNADDVVFVRNTTEAANLLAVALPPGTRVLCSSFEHHANLLPWRQHRVTHLPFTTTAAAFLAAAADALEEAERAGDPFSLVAITGASNVTGEVPPVAEVARLAHARGALVFVDAAQLAPHRRIDLHELEADFLAFSGHKVYAPFGTGVLVSPADGLADGSPLLHGGGAVRIVTLEGVAWAETPRRYEAGTPNLLGAVALGAACDALTSYGMDAVAEHERPSRASSGTGSTRSAA